MDYYWRKTLFHTSFAAFVEQLKRELNKEGFLIVASSDIKKVLEENLQLRMKRYEIMNVIIPHLFSEMLRVQPFTGFVLPCQIVVCEKGSNEVELVIIDSTGLMAETVGGPSLQNIANEVGRRLKGVLALLSDKKISATNGVH